MGTSSHVTGPEPKVSDPHSSREQSKLKKKDPNRQRKSDQERVKREKTRRDANNARER